MALSERCPNLATKKDGRWQEFICTRDPDTPCTRQYCDRKQKVVMTDAEEP